PETKSWSKLELRASIAFDVERDFLLCPVVVEIESSVLNANITYRKGSPVRGNMRCKCNCVGGSAALQSQQSAQHGTDNHGCRPDLVRRAGREWLVIIAGKNLSHMAERSVQRQQCIRAQI